MNEFALTISDIPGKQKFTREEMDSICERLDLLDQKFVTERKKQDA